MIVFLLVFLAFYTLKKQLLANARLQDVLGTLKQQSLRLEEMGAVAERNRIAGEIHDTVGHTLTTAVISIEAGQKLMEADPIAAREKFALAGEQIKQGLSDIRGSVKMIQTGGEEAFEPALLRLLEDIRQNTDMKVTLIVELKTELLPIQQSILLRAVKECATNSLKHGGSTEADVLVQQYKDTVRLTFSDNGRGTSQIRYGFGLSTMAQRVQSIGGTLYADSSPGEGFSVNIAIPVKEGGIV
jgi:signal transduction histidine kinase